MKLKLFAMAVLVFLSSLALAQDTASLTGTVRDKSGAIVPNASVTVSNPATNVVREVKSNGEGEYLAGGLPPGTYNLTVSAPGFQKFDAKGVVLRVAQKSRVDVNLSVGSVNTEVVVQGEGLTNVQTESNEEGAVITGKEITQLELNGRNFTQLITLTPGVSNQTGQDEGTVGVNGNVQFSVNGGRTEYNNWELDGGDNMDNGSNSTLNVYPSIEAIGEFRVLTSNYGAQYGRNGSGTVEVETKSGTNHFHGSLYEFLRNDAFNARNFFQGAVPPYKKNDYGYNVGGPIFKNKTYFFWSQEWRRDRVPSTFSNIHVPSLTERQGNFSDLCPDATGSSANCPTNPATGLPFPGNQVPVDPNGAALLAVIPTPTGVDANGNSIFSASPSFPTNWREELVRVDQDLGSNVRATFRYIHDSWNTTTATPLWSNIGTFPTTPTAFSGPAESLVAKLTATASPTLLNEFVFSYTTDHINLQDQGKFQRPASMTLPGLFGTGTAGKLPGFQLTGGGLFGFGQDVNFHPEGPYNSNPTYTFRDNLTKVLGKHTVVVGAYFAAAQKNELVGQLPGGVGATNGFLTFNSNNSGISTGNAFADLLMGNISSFSQQNIQPKYYNRYKIVEPYIQDDWHIRKNLTLNLGVRFSLFGLYHELNRQAFNFDPSKYVQGASGINPDGTVSGNPFNGLVQCGAGGVPGGCMQNHLFNPAPRVGFAWDPWGDSKTSIRGGYGIFFEHTNGNESNTESLEGSAPAVQVPVQSNIIGYNNIGGGGSSLFPLNVISLPNKINWPYIQQWHFDIQHEIMRNTVATVAYVGTKGTHLSQIFDLNQIAPLPLNQNPYALGEAIGPNDCTTFTTPSGVPITGQAAINLQVACGSDPNPFRPFLGYGNITRVQDSGSSIYHAFEASLRHTAGRLQLNASYTWSHAIDDSSDRFDSGFVNSFDLAASRASSNFDQRHIFNFSYVYDLPFFNSGTGLARTLLGGWEWSGITTFSTGSPFTVLNGVFGDNAGVGNGTGSGSFPDVTGNPNGNIPSQTPGAQVAPFLLNPGAFAAPRGLTFGNAGRNFLRNPNHTNFDMALIKHFKIRESMGLEFRTEAFNVFNHTEWGYFGGGGGSAAFNTGTLNSGTNTAGCYAGPNNSAGDPSCLASSSFLQMTAAHNPRILQLALKFSF
ncbi:MAG TPA: carboxypeptidase regulatory-like domain-containing protein [Candidatus Angelobacter sp.]